MRWLVVSGEFEEAGALRLAAFASALAAADMLLARAGATGGVAAGAGGESSSALGGLGAPASTPKPSQNWPPEVNMTPEQAAIIEAAYALKYQKQISEGTMPSIPGAESNPLLNNGNTPGQPKPKSNF